MKKTAYHIVILYIVLFFVFVWGHPMIVNAKHIKDNVEVRTHKFDSFFSMVMSYIGENDANDEYDMETLYDRLSVVYDAPIDWNSATRAQLEDLLFLSPKTVENLLYYADVYGPVRSINELVMVPGIEPPMLRILPELLVVREREDTIKWSDAFKRQIHKAFIRTDFVAEPYKGSMQAGKPYQGVPARILAQYRFVAGNNFKAAVALESDAGEPFVGRGAQGFDLYRFYAQLSNLPVVERVVFGAYKASFGHGLLFGDMSYGSNDYKLLNIGNSRNSIVGYGGVSELPSLFGVAATTKIKLKKRVDLNVTALYSYTLLDADTTGGKWHSIITTGYHRTSTELAKRGTLSLHTLGANVSIRSHYFHLGVITYGGIFSLPAVAQTIASSDIAFVGNKQFGLSVHYMVRGKGVRFSGETAISGCGAMATVNELHISPKSTSVVVALGHRSVTQKYHQFWAKIPFSSGYVVAEHGGSIAMKFPLWKNSYFTAFADVYIPLKSTSVTSNRDIGYETLLAINAMHRKVNYELKLRYTSKPRWYYVDNDKLSLTSTERVALLRCKVRYPVLNSLIFNSGFYANLAHSVPGDVTKSTLGCMVYHDADYSPSDVPLSLRTRLAFNYSPTWDNRFYLYEYDVSVAGFSPVLYGVSLRWLFMIKYQLPKYFVLSARVAQSVYFDRDVISSGYTKIDSNHRTDFHLSLAYVLKSDKRSRSKVVYDIK